MGATPSTPIADNVVGSVIGGRAAGGLPGRVYEITDLVSDVGGSAILYKARAYTQCREADIVAKVYNFTDEHAEMQYRRESAFVTKQRAEHIPAKHIVIFEGAWTNDEVGVIEMEELQGSLTEALGNIRPEGGIDPVSATERVEVAARVVSQIGLALSNLHEAGVAHGDIKSANIMLTDPDADMTMTDYKVIDFGMACMSPMGCVGGGSHPYTDPAYIHHVGTDVRVPLEELTAGDTWSLGVVVVEVVFPEIFDQYTAEDGLKVADITVMLHEKGKTPEYRAIVNVLDQLMKAPGKRKLLEAVTLAGDILSG